ncbi:PREDICTED: T-complex-associated testis-expressed protein 1-like [Branchiostoma belcheri]|uniref:T-complex-associated testis-expressed protein 1-like n=1 Tax=Branchiostoma belcheri TaxID=7741 RepID=A0A6P5AXW7_BRABE|nr:PREDICTED: T-complex-associated testis-expressed protein 1-like [Branchiostoma belcheri]
MDIVTDVLPLSGEYIKKLNIKQLLPPIKEETKRDDDTSETGSELGDGPEVDHFEFGPVFEKLPHLEEFGVTYGVKDCGMNFEWNLFQFTTRDCLLLSKAVKSCKTLQKFHLCRSKVDDDKVRVLISHLLDHPSLMELDLSHNMIGDSGARAAGKLINRSRIVKMNLCDNKIGAPGAQAIGHAVSKNTTLKCLDLRLNRLGDDGGQAICRALLKNSTLTDLNIGSNNMTEPTASILSQVLTTNTTVRTINLSCNRVGPLEKISTNIPLKVTAHLISDEGYWQRCCKARWEICDVSQYGGSWKRMYFERNLEHIIEHFVPERSNMDIVTDVLPLSGEYIKKLNIKQLLPPIKEETKRDDDTSETGSELGDGPEVDHFEFGPVFEKLPHLEEFGVTYGVKDCGMNFEWNLFQFTTRDCLLLSKAVKSCKTLQKFHLCRSKVDDDKVRVLISHLLDHPSLIELDLSHNMIGDSGARAAGKLINRSRIVKMNLCDNKIGAPGAQAIGHAVSKNTTLKCLDLRLNRLGDDGGQAICRALLKNSTLTDLNIGSNNMTEPTASILSQVLTTNTTVRTINLSCNRVGPDGGKQLQEGMEENSTVLEMDLRLTEAGQESEYCINQILKKNREDDRELRLQNEKNKQS